MKNRTLGQLQTKVSSIGIGGMSFCDAYGKSSSFKTNNILSTALELGINHIDTSDIYGLGISEKRIGDFIKKNKSLKNKFVIATKGGVEIGNNGKRRFNNSKKYLKKSLENSLKRLRLEQIELYYVHRREANRPIEEVTLTLKDFVNEGKIKQIGFSEISPSSLIKASNYHNIAAVQSEYSLSTRYPELGLLQNLTKLNSTLIAFSPLGRSLLTDKPHLFQKAQKIKLLQNNPRFLEPNLTENIKISKNFRILAKEIGTSAAALAIAWLLKKSDNIIPIPGTRSKDHLISLAEGVKLNLTNEMTKTIEKILPLGWAHGDRYSDEQWIGPEKYC